MSAPQVNGNHAGASSTTESIPTATASKVQPNDVGFQFVPQYYNFVNKQPNRLHCFYNKKSTFIHGEEGEETLAAFGQTEIHERITAIGYNQCKVFIHSIDSQSSAGGGIIILVIGEMSNDSKPWKKFTQTFFLAEQPGGYFVLNDIFRFLKEESDDEEELDEDDVEVEEAPAVVEESAPVQEKIEEPTPVEAEPEPAPVSAPAHPTEEIPVEAEVAAIPDEDVAPEDPAPEIEEPTTSTNPPIAESVSEKAPSPAATPAAKAAAPNGTAAPASTPAPAKPAAPKSWASLAASAGKGAWGTAVSTAQAGASVATTAVAAVAPAIIQPKKEESAPAAAPAASASGPSGRSPAYDAVFKVNTPHCFVKLPNWSIENPNGGDSIDENALRQAVTRFGEVVKVEIVRAKACAFVEFKTVESARKAIIASLQTSQGGEGGVKVGDGKINLETRKDKEDRTPKGGRRGGAPESTRGATPTGQRQQNGASGPGAGAGRGRGRGRGGMPSQGERVNSQPVASK
ncbi:hypothetical protein P7C73_g1453, partial [Tremellales sp. Uapishka_1]